MAPCFRMSLCNLCNQQEASICAPSQVIFFTSLLVLCQLHVLLLRNPEFLTNTIPKTFYLRFLYLFFGGGDDWCSEIAPARNTLLWLSSSVSTVCLVGFWMGQCWRTLLFIKRISPSSPWQPNRHQTDRFSMNDGILLAHWVSFAAILKWQQVYLNWQLMLETFICNC